ncbi:carboxymuconolactone decarboxylase family protein [Amycolatopsis anabasis]|uniref:carboxymuconolactone decarboxylase family protein n=1 Tax=Amycolatopsis anabasis TaxID=1840409 RepID=UPI00131E64E6|nr:carboxymuconolactone decarboxylase family protein [Amycolatopsis anabasis]
MVQEPRIRPGTRRELGLPVWLFTRLAALRTKTRPPRLFTVLGRHRRLFRGWLHFAATMMPGGLLPRRDSELVILRVAALRENRYELEHHRRLAAAAGLTGDEIARVVDVGTQWDWGDRDAALLRAVDALQADRDLDDTRWAELRRNLSEKECLEFCLLVTHYDLLATVITTLRIEPDSPRGG